MGNPGIQQEEGYSRGLLGVLNWKWGQSSGSCQLIQPGVCTTIAGRLCDFRGCPWG